MKCEAPLGYLDALELSRSLSRAPARVVLVAGSHCAPASCPSHNRSCEYVAALVRYFEGRFPSARVSLRLGHTADEDLVFMSGAKEFVPSGGVYSMIAAGLVTAFGGRVVKRATIAGLQRE